jgi:uncharacterized repeat protein (TIGR01451 family)
VDLLPKSSQISFISSCFKRLIAAILLGIIPTMDIPVGGQQTTSTVNLTNQASYSYTDSSNPSAKYQGASSQLNVAPQPLVDPLGRIVGCSGATLTSYTGFSVGLYNPNPGDPTGTQLGSLVSLTPTQFPAVPNSNIPAGKAPNTQNSNPYSLANSQPAGTYNFLLDSSKHQTDPGTSYILLVNVPSNSVYTQRRVKIQILDSTGVDGNNIVRYTATSLDGQPISSTGATQVQGNIVLVPNAQLTSLELFAFQLTTNLCQTSQVQIVKTGDRATAEPGDTAIYRLSVKNLSDSNLNNIVVTDSLPLGFHFLPKSVQGAINNAQVTITTSVSGSTVTFSTNTAIPSQQTLNIAYAVQLNNDAQRGTGVNSAIVNAQRTDNQFNVKDGPTTYKLKVQSGIVSDCGTILGRVFVDKNFDGEQQPGEAGIPNAVIYLEDGTRITTDPNGLFSLANVLPGYHTGVLDLTTLPGYTLAPNRKFRERNSQSRLVHVEPGGLVRMNFAVTPSFREQVQK